MRRVRGGPPDAETLYAEARAHFETALTDLPVVLAADGWPGDDPVAPQRYDEALVLYERASKAWPGNFASLTNWGRRCGNGRRRRKRERRRSVPKAGAREADELDREADAGIRQAIEKINQAIAMMPSYAHAHLIRALLWTATCGEPDMRRRGVRAGAAPDAGSPAAAADRQRTGAPEGAAGCRSSGTR